MTIAQQITEDKVWGQVAHLFHADHCAVSYLEVRAFYRCSKHVHHWRANQFSVIRGKIVVEEFDPTNLELVKSVPLLPGQTYTVSSGVPHRFRVIDTGVVIEVYWPDMVGGAVLLDDIERFDEGGVDGEDCEQLGDFVEH